MNLKVYSTNRTSSPSFLGAAGLLLFNLIFVAGPFLAISCAIIAIVAAAAVMVLSPIAILGGIGVGLSDDEWQLGIFASLTLFGLGLLLGTGTAAVGRWFFRMMFIYFKRNWMLIRGD